MKVLVNDEDVYKTVINGRKRLLVGCDRFWFLPRLKEWP